MKKRLSKKEVADLRYEAEFFLWNMETAKVSEDWKAKIRNNVVYWRGVVERRPEKEIESIHHAVQRIYEDTFFALYRDGELF